MSRTEFEREMEWLITAAPPGARVAIVLNVGDRISIRDNSNITGLVGDDVQKAALVFIKTLFPDFTNH